MITKFRAWDKEHDEMLYPDDVDKIYFEITVDGIVTYDMRYILPYDDIPPYLDTVIMQSTGLTDVNGKEIFEGDIVKALSEGYCGTFQVKWRNEGTPMYILYPAWQNEQFWDLKGVNGVDDGIEVIGNIHEHPELLNQPNE